MPSNQSSLGTLSCVCFDQVPEDRHSVSNVSAVLVDEESVGPVNGPVSGAKVLHRDPGVEAVLS